MKRYILTAAMALTMATQAHAVNPAIIMDNTTKLTTTHTNKACQYPNLVDMGFEAEFYTSTGQVGCYTYVAKNDTLYIAAPNGNTTARRMVDIAATNTVIAKPQSLTANQIRAITYTPQTQSAPSFTCMTAGPITSCQ